MLVRGGVFLYPRDSKDPKKVGGLRLVYEANPMAMLVAQAGGSACSRRILEIIPHELHQRIPGRARRETRSGAPDSLP